MEKHDIGEQLLRCRKAANLTQAYVAKELGVRQTAVSNWEGNVSRPSLEMLIKLTRLYSVSLNTLCGVAEKKEKEYKLSRMIYDLSAACYSGVLKIEKSKDGTMLFKLPVDYFLYSEETEDEELNLQYVTHGTTEYFETLKDLLGIRTKGLNADSVITSWVLDTVGKTKEDGDLKGFKSSSTVYGELMGYDEE